MTQTFQLNNNATLTSALTSYYHILPNAIDPGERIEIICAYTAENWSFAHNIPMQITNIKLFSADHTLLLEETDTWTLTNIHLLIDDNGDSRISIELHRS